MALGGLVHVAAIFGGPDWYAFLGAPARLVAMASTSSFRPAVSCVVIALALFTCAVYAFSGAGVFLKLPGLRTVLSFIALGLIARGITFVPVSVWRPHLLSSVCGKCGGVSMFLLITSALCLIAGGGYAAGALRVRA
jgi:hypothetical protein